ncbi:uncharacterized protein PHACADRAFT_264976 [Phanerochaete carnosa HHB-10118-sp]|uniref:Lariat debranching enzyme C-terminal domain-containing protein n=1 Tax=Phanerochaete carnosa (strain HHB-10118-sp) TaxID=650164 RepID=K5UL44_PHACS|nr:uncharacterized protein PHACADRAFT_264976 [Phanerochaete carnosa HHB-10118-sp]EKM50346.1 hypothetical protein PHACADRAFT_264976 [Phanerochaete carnosa HHB-10118-sp]
MKVAVEGCCHGELDAIYAQIAHLEQKNDYKVDLLLVCGDFQAIRNERDLQCMAVPDKYRKLGEFYKYYTSEKAAPILTIVIGGNHEASNYFWELYHGGWLAPNIYFLGHAGCVQVNGTRIAGASGIFKPHDFIQGHHERLPYSASAMRSIYHVREYNIRRLSLLSPPDVFLSHDWPASIEHYGNLPQLLKRKPFFRADIDKGQLGSPPLMGLLRQLRPHWWFAAHLHARFEAFVRHVPSDNPPEQSPELTKVENPDEITIDDDEFDTSIPMPSSVASLAVSTPVLPSDPPAASTPAPVPTNPDEITLDDEEADVAVPPPPLSQSPFAEPTENPPGHETRFLALDKCLPRRQFLEVVDIPSTNAASPPVLTFDAEWLAVARAFNVHMPLGLRQAQYPSEDEARTAVREASVWVRANVSGVGPDANGSAAAAALSDVPNETADTSNIPDALPTKRIDDVQQFAITAPPPGTPGSQGRTQPPYYPNPQTAAFCRMLGVENLVDTIGMGRSEV